MDIAIIGAGNVGRALADAFVRAGHSVAITRRQDAQDVAKETGARAVDSNQEAADAAPVVVLAVPFDGVETILAELRGHLDDKVLVDVTNRVDFENPASTMDGTSNAELIQLRAPDAHVVKAFNTVFAARQVEPVVDGTQLDGFVAGDHQESKDRILGLVGDVGFRPIDAGELAMARALESMAVLHMVLQVRHGWTWQTGWKLVGPTS